LVDNFNAMVKVLLLRFLLFLLRSGLGFLFFIFLFLRNNDLGPTLQFLLPLFAKLNLSRCLVLWVLVLEGSYRSKTLTIIDETMAQVDRLMVWVAIDEVFFFLLQPGFVLFFSLFALLFPSLPLFLSLFILFLLFLPLLFLFLSFLFLAGFLFLYILLPFNFFLKPSNISQKVLLILIIVNRSGVSIHIVIDCVLQLIPLLLNSS